MPKLDRRILAQFLSNPEAIAAFESMFRKVDQNLPEAVGGAQDLAEQAASMAEMSVPVLTLRAQVAELRSVVEQLAPPLKLHRQIADLRAELRMIEDPAVIVRHILVNLGKRLRVDTAAQGLTTAQKTNAKTNLDLQNVDNTTDANKPVSSATLTELNKKAPIATPSFTGGVKNVSAGITTVMSADAAGSYLESQGANPLRLLTNGGEKVRIDASGNLLAGKTGGSCHALIKSGVTPGNAGFYVSTDGDVHIGFVVSYCDLNDWNASSSATYFGRYGGTGRSINAGGTINASGADYAEYMTKADDCGVIAKGQIVGVRADGKLTDKWAAAVSFMIKSTDPSYVGGDVWGEEGVIGAVRPQLPVFEVPVYTGVAHPGVEPEPPADETDEEAVAIYESASGQYLALLASYQADQQAHADMVATAQAQFDSVTMPTYQSALADFEVLLEAARQKVDRIAFCGQVPVNVTGAAPGQYVVPAQDGDGIASVLVNDVDISFEQYRRAVGRVQNILPDGRANVVVKPI